MPEILYEIPVNDIFDRPCECPVCAMQKKLDDDEVAFAMGPSYMEVLPGMVHQLPFLPIYHQPQGTGTCSRRLLI